ncbi:MAG: hypothetical protein KGJ80_16655 [Chloroflexota bacterium]|nr:hypothetical protein [Chloroflexota bacterium]
MPHWFVVYTKPRCESQAADALALRGGIETYLPLLPAASPRAGRRATRPFFPCYLFAHFDLDTVGVSRVNWTPGVRRLVTFGGVPAHVDERVVQKIRAHLAQPHDLDQQGEILEHGDPVTITADPWREVEAVFDRRLSAAGRARVMIYLLQRWTAVDLDAEVLRKQ